MKSIKEIRVRIEELERLKQADECKYWEGKITFDEWALSDIGYKSTINALRWVLNNQNS